MALISKVVRVSGILFVTLCLASRVSSAWRQEPGQERSTPPPSVPDAYSFLYKSSRTEWEPARQRLPYESITINRRGCFGTCPVYSATIRVDGTATYNGERYVEHVGQFSGSVYLGDFAQLSMFVERSGFMKLADRYAAPETDHETVTVTVTSRGGTGKTVVDYGSFGPPDLWVLERAIDGVVDRIKWTAVVAGRDDF
jgi:hypothetical protein